MHVSKNRPALNRLVTFCLSLVVIAVLAGGSVFAQDDPAWVEYTSGDVRFTYPEDLATEIVETVYEPVEWDATSGMPLFAATPGYLEYSFVDYPTLQDAYHLPIIQLYPTENFEAYTLREGDFPFGLGIELENLATILEEQPDLSVYETVTAGGPGDILPSLPLANAAQVFRAQVEYIPFDDGIGVRFLTYYSQAPGPIREQDIFYTFQGISSDGSTYVSVSFPLVSGFLPTTIEEGFDFEAFMADYETYMTDTHAALNGQDGELFTPTLATLDQIVLSLSINGTIDYVAPEVSPEATEEAGG